MYQRPQKEKEGFRRKNRKLAKGHDRAQGERERERERHGQTGRLSYMPGHG
jgi:hypothetical protein